MSHVPVITLDGPSGAGKGTVGRLVAQRLHFHFLDSGLLYRAIGWWATQQQWDIHQPSHWKAELEALSLDCGEDRCRVNAQDLTPLLRTEACGQMASLWAVLPEVRAALLHHQRRMARLPGLVADGRDMGTVVFPDAALKIYLDASLEARAERRLAELKLKGVCITINDVLREIEQRDQRDRSRGEAPLRAASDAILLDTSTSSIEKVVDDVMVLVAKIGEIDV